MEDSARRGEHDLVERARAGDGDALRSLLEAHEAAKKPYGRAASRLAKDMRTGRAP